MALSANVAWRIRTTGAEANGGGFDPSLTTNMLADGAATSATGNSPVFSSASYNFVAGDVGAAIYIAAGTNWVAGWYPIASVASNQATLAAAIDPLKGNAILPNGDASLTAGCATTASPTGATWSIDYSWLAAAPKSASDLTSTASTTATSASAGLHKAMIGNILRIASGSGATADYYAVVNVASATSMTLDRACGTTTAGVFKIGGAHAHIYQYSNGGGGTAPLLATPLLAGHRIFVRGGGTDTPGSVDYNWNSYWNFPYGDLTNGCIGLIAYNGRPRIDTIGLLGFGCDKWLVIGFLFYHIGGFTIYGIFGNQGTLGCNARDCVFDQAGQDSCMWSTYRSSLSKCRFFDSANASAGSAAVIVTGHVGCSITGCVFDGCIGPAVILYGRCVLIQHSYFINCKADAVWQSATDSTVYMDEIVNCTFDNNAGHAIQFDTTGMGITKVTNCIFSNHTGSGKKAFNCADALDVNLRLARHMIDYNCFYGNTTNFNGWQLNTHDITTDPGYANAGSKDYSVGANMKAKGFPSTLPGVSMLSYVDLGAAQRAESGGGSASYARSRVANAGGI